MRALAICLVALGSAVATARASEAPARPEEAASVRVLVAYYSAGGSTRAMAAAVARGARSRPGAEVRLRPVDRASAADLRWADAIVLGSPVLNANVAPEMQAFLNSWPFDGSLRDKIGAAFATGGGFSAGEEAVQLALLRSMLVFGMLVVGGEDWRSAFGASAILEEGPFAERREGDEIPSLFTEKAEALGARVARLAGRMAAGREPVASPAPPRR